MTLLCACLPCWAFWENTDGQATLTTKRDGDPRITTEPSDPAQLARSIKPAWRRRLDLFGRAAAEVLSVELLEEAAAPTLHSAYVARKAPPGPCARRPLCKVLSPRH